jgi:two-component system chemotaxis response regulator CheY
MPRTILLVDDDPLIRAAYGELLRQEGFRVVEAADGCEALLATGSFDGDCLILLDQFMPCLDGHEFLERLTRRPDANRFRVVIIASGTGAERLLHTGTEVAAVVEKPFSADELLSTVHRLAA